MKKVLNINSLFKLLLTFIMLMIFTGCGDKNKYDGENGLITGISNTSSIDIDTSIASIYDEIIVKDSNDTYHQSLLVFQSLKDFNSSTNASNLLDAQNKFKKLVLLYKRVESIYIAGYEDNNMRDIAEFYIEQYIKGSKAQDIVSDLDAVFAGNKSLVVNSLKGITALEYTIFGENEDSTTLLASMNQTRLDASLVMIAKISGHLNEVNNYYINTSTFKSGSIVSVESLLNVLSQQSFNLREWRIGEPAGFTSKYLNNPSITRLEYYKSRYTLEAIKEILNTQKDVIENGLSDIATYGGVSNEIDAILIAINDAIDICNTYPSTLSSGLTSSKTRNLYDTTKTIENGYTALINSINLDGSRITQDIIEADGD